LERSHAPRLGLHVVTRFEKGRPTRSWQPKHDGERNEALDTFVYVSATLHGLISMGLRLNEESEAMAAVRRRTGPSGQTSPARHPLGADGMRGLQVPADIHALVQHADNDKVRFSEAEKYEMGTDRIFEVAIPDIDGTPDLPATRQIVKHADDDGVVAVRLLKRPVLERVEPDFFEVGFRPG
jgi:hypothetical protein